MSSITPHDNQVNVSPPSHISPRAPEIKVAHFTLDNGKTVRVTYTGSINEANLKEKVSVLARAFKLGEQTKSGDTVTKLVVQGDQVIRHHKVKEIKRYDKDEVTAKIAKYHSKLGSTPTGIPQQPLKAVQFIEIRRSDDFEISLHPVVENLPSKSVSFTQTDDQSQAPVPQQPITDPLDEKSPVKKKKQKREVLRQNQNDISDQFDDLSK